MKRIAFLLCAASALVAIITAPALAQVAAPRLNPNAFEADNAINPATVPWSGPSRIGLGILDGSEERTVNGVTTPDSEQKSKYVVQGRYVGENFAVSAETAKVEYTSSNNPTQSAEFDVAVVNGAFVIGEMFSIGIGLQNLTGEFKDSTAPADSNKAEFTLPQVGLALNFDGFSLGASTGTETIKKTSVSPPAADVQEEVDRKVTRAGVGYAMRDSDKGLHIEAFKETKEYADFTNLNDDNEEDSTGVVLEVVFANILLGVEAVSTEKNDKTGKLSSEKDAKLFSIGWVPEQGLSVTVTVEQDETTNPFNSTVSNEDSTFVGVAWLF